MNLMANASEFPGWVQKELDGRGWKQADLARKTSMNSGYISQIMNGIRSPGVEFCRALARAFNMRDSDVMRVAGLVSSNEPDDQTPSLREMIMRFARLSDDDQESILKMVRALDEMEQADKRRAGRLKPKTG